MDSSQSAARQNAGAPERPIAHRSGDAILARGTKTTRHVWRRTRRAIRAAYPSWTPLITVLALGAAFAVVLLSAHDAEIFIHVRQSGWPVFRFLNDITDVTLSQWFLLPALAIVLVVGLLDWSALGRRAKGRLALIYGEAAFVFVTMLGTGILTNILKQVIGRARPRIMEEAGPLVFHPLQFDHAWQSFPSGHATTAGALAMALMLFHPRWRWPLAAGCAALAFARVAAGAHYPSDIVAGFFVGAFGTLWAARWLAGRGIVFRADGANVLPRAARRG